MYAAFEEPARQDREEGLDEVDPGRTRRREVAVEARVANQPPLDPRRLVRGVVVHDEVHVESGGNGTIDEVEERNELLTAVLSIALADDAACRDVERRKE